MNPDDPKTNPEHIGNIAAGFKRSEENRRRTDRLAERQETEAAPVEAIDPEKLRNVDNDIAQQVTREVNRGTPRVKFSNPQPGYGYKWLPNPDCYTSVEASLQAQNQCDTFMDGGDSTIGGGEWVEGDMPEAKELAGKGRRNMTTRRGWGDCLLARLRNDVAEARYRWFVERERRRGAIDQNWINQLASSGFTGSADPNHPAFKRSSPNAGEIETYQINDRALRTGEIRDPRTGQLLRPGFER